MGLGVVDYGGRYSRRHGCSAVERMGDGRTERGPLPTLLSTYMAHSAVAQHILLNAGYEALWSVDEVWYLPHQQVTEPTPCIFAYAGSGFPCTETTHAGSFRRTVRHAGTFRHTEIRGRGGGGLAVSVLSKDMVVPDSVAGCVEGRYLPGTAPICLRVSPYLSSPALCMPITVLFFSHLVLDMGFGKY
eukprot:1697432-Rhodomonas_salina.2